MKRKNIIMSILSLAILFTSNIKIVLAGDNGFGDLPKVQFESEYDVSYYSNIKGLKGDNLLEGLALISQENHQYFTSYGELRSALAYSDEDPNDQSKILDFYTGWSLNNTWSPDISSSDSKNPWNREHVWCQSKSNGLFGEKYAGADIHHVRPENSKINNNIRNNALFADLDDSYSFNLDGVSEPTECYRDGQNYFEPRDASKGDVARILMYVYMHYSSEIENNKNYKVGTNNVSGNLVISNIVYTNENTNQAAWNLLLKWNELDPVDEFESNRNDYCASITGVRNPFIDHEEFANMIWNTSYNGDGALNDTNVPSNKDDEEIETPSINTSSTYIFSEYDKGTQYKENEEHILDENVKMYTTQCHFTDELRIYSSSTHNGYVIIKSTKNINKIDLNLGYNVDTLNIYNEEDNIIGSINASSSYSDYSLSINPSLNYLKFDVNGTNQLRIKSMILYFDDLENIKDQFNDIETTAQLDFSYNYIEGNNTNVNLLPNPSTSTYMDETNNNYAKLLGLDESIFKVTAEKGKSNYYPYIHINKEVRIYAYRQTGEGNIFNVELINQKIKINSITLNTSYEENLIIKDSKGNTINKNNSQYKIDDYKFSITNAQSSGDNNQTAILKSIAINYGEEKIYSNFNSVNIRYSASINNELFEHIDSYGINIKVDDNSKDYEITKVTTKEDNKEFALVIKDIDDYNIKITATAYIFIDNERIELTPKTYSVSTMIDYYILNAIDLELTQDQIEVLNAFKESL